MKILMVSTEVAPFAKTGGLADAVAALSIELERKDNEVCIVVPRYYSINRDNLEKVISNLPVQTYSEEIFVDVYKTQLDNSNVTVYFLDYEKLYGREGIYGNQFGEFKDNPLRFSVLSHAVFSICEYLNWTPEIIHANDWSTALVPVLLKLCKRTGRFRNTASVFTIHNLGYQGKYPLIAYRLLGIDESLLIPSGFKQYEQINHMLAAITSSDLITTVSPSYAKEILDEENGFGLSGMLYYRQHDLTGILNGVDYLVWNPDTDSYLPARFNSSDLKGKEICKSELQKTFNLPVSPEKPIVSFIARFAKQKGINEMFQPFYGCMYKMCTQIDAQFVVIGSGEAWCEKELEILQSILPNLRYYKGYSESVAHLVEAGSDFFLMPSEYEPCGLNQMYSQIYGTVPIVHHCGGLKDSVDVLGVSENPTGFAFYDLYPDAILNTVRMAVSVYRTNRELYKKLQSNGMKKDFSWSLSAQSYETVYKQALKKITH